MEALKGGPLTKDRDGLVSQLASYKLTNYLYAVDARVGGEFFFFIPIGQLSNFTKS